MISLDRDPRANYSIERSLSSVDTIQTLETSTVYISRKFKSVTVSECTILWNTPDPPLSYPLPFLGISC
jgi:hypothetical protein